MLLDVDDGFTNKWVMKEVTKELPKEPKIDWLAKDYEYGIQ